MKIFRKKLLYILINTLLLSLCKCVYKKYMYLYLCNFDHDPKQEYFKNRNSYQNIVSRQFTAIRLAASTTSMSQELSRMVKNAREENARRGGWVRIFPTAETWPNYGSMLEFSSPNNQILHEHLFPDAARKVPSFR